jgi:hypothetical protein
MTPFDDLSYLEQSTFDFEDLILLIGTLVAFIAFVLWCCFPIEKKATKDTNQTSFSNQLQSHKSSYSSTKELKKS